MTREASFAENLDFIEAPLAKHRIESHMEANLAMHEFMYSFLPDGTINGDEVKKDEDKEAYNMVATSSLTLEGLTPPEIRQFRKLQKETRDVLDQENLPGFVSGPLKEILSGAKDDGLTGMKKFFALMSPDITDITAIEEEDAAPIDLNDRSGLLTFLATPHKEEELKKFVSGDFVTKLDQMEAEELLKDIPGQPQIA